MFATCVSGKQDLKMNHQWKKKAFDIKLALTFSQAATTLNETIVNITVTDINEKGRQYCCCAVHWQAFMFKNLSWLLMTASAETSGLLSSLWSLNVITVHCNTNISKTNTYTVVPFQDTHIQNIKLPVMTELYLALTMFFKLVSMQSE